MTVSQTLTRSPILEQIPKHGTLFMSGYGLRLQVQHGHLCADWGVGRDRHNTRLSRVNRDLKRIIVAGSGGFATFDALRLVADIGASLIFLDGRGKVLFASTPTAPSDVRLRRAQCLALENGTALKISRELISQKIDGQAAIVREMLGNSVAADAILRFKTELAETQDIDAVRLVEALAAKMYWSQWADVPIRWPLKDEPRVAAHWKIFGSRISPLTHSPRLAANPPNACMNLIHALCEAECRIAAVAMGLDPAIGCLHVDAPNRHSLACDLMEVCRPCGVDAFVLNWLQSEPLRHADFWEDRNGNCRIVSSLATRLCETAATWRKLVAPVAEYVAQELWSSISKPSSRLSRLRLASRLTQAHRRTVKGSTVPAVNQRKPEHVCSDCGVKISRRTKLCSNCAKQATRKNLRVGRKDAQRPESLAKRSATQRQHKQAIHNWRP